MPEVAKFDGIKILFYHNEHQPAHFHVVYAEFKAVVLIDTLEIDKGWLPTPQMRKIRAWAFPRRQALAQAWLICQEGGDPGSIL